MLPRIYQRNYLLEELHSFNAKFLKAILITKHCVASMIFRMYICIIINFCLFKSINHIFTELNITTRRGTQFFKSVLSRFVFCNVFVPEGTGRLSFVLPEKKSIFWCTCVKRI